MSKVARKKDVNEASLAALLSDDRLDIEVDGNPLRLTQPSVQQVGAFMDYINASQEDDKDSGERVLNIAMQAIGLCLPMLSGDQAWQLMTRAGGPDSALVLRCLELCAKWRERFVRHGKSTGRKPYRLLPRSAGHPSVWWSKCWPCPPISTRGGLPFLDQYPVGDFHAFHHLLAQLAHIVLYGPCG